MKKHHFFLAIIFFVAIGCSSKKNISTVPITPAPQWVKDRPVSGNYYTGIGSSIKTTDINKYQQTAKQNALADLVTDIKVNISSNSLLYAFETNLNLKEDFSSTIQTHSEDILENYELVETWEDENNYWVYFRLLKSEYQRLKEERKSKAAAIAVDYYDKGITAMSSVDIRLALFNLIKSLEPLKPYFSDPILTNYKGKEIYLGNEIFREISLALSAIRIEPKNQQVTVQQGKELAPGSLDFKVFANDRKAIPGIPVLASYTEKPIRNNKIKTDGNGIASFLPDVVRSGKNTEQFKISINLEDIASEATNDLFLRRLFIRFPAPESIVVINVVKPTFVMVSNESNLGNLLSPGMISDALKRKLMESGYTFLEKIADADYQIIVTAATQMKGEFSGYKQTILSGSVSVKDKSGAEVYLKQIENIPGAHFDYQNAGLEAYKEVVKKVESSIARELLEGVLKIKSY